MVKCVTKILFYFTITFLRVTKVAFLVSVRKPAIYSSLFSKLRGYIKSLNEFAELFLHRKKFQRKYFVYIYNLCTSFDYVLRSEYNLSSEDVNCSQKNFIICVSCPTPQFHF